MRIIIQRVTNSSVTVSGTAISKISKGYNVLAAIHKNDTEDDIDYIVKKILTTKLFNEDDGRRWTQSIVDVQGEILCVSQFTLYGVLKGKKPDFHRSLNPDDSRFMFEKFVSKLREMYTPEKCKVGQFQTFSVVEISNCGPTTIIIDSKDRNM